MNNKQNTTIYYVDDIEDGVLISTETKEHPGKRLFPELPALTFICHNSSDATDIANLILNKQQGIPSEDFDIYIDVNEVYFLGGRFAERDELKVM